MALSANAGRPVFNAGDLSGVLSYPKTGHLQLLDLRTDPHQATNLAGRPEHAGHVARLQELKKSRTSH